MFDVLSRGFKNATLLLQGKAELTEEVLQQALREVRTSLLQADVDLDVTNAFLRVSILDYRMASLSQWWEDGTVWTIKTQQRMAARPCGPSV